MHTPEHVYVVDDDESIRHLLMRRLSEAGYEVSVFASAQEFLAVEKFSRPCCLLVDVRMPEVDGLALQQRLLNLQRHLPVIFMTGYRDVTECTQAMRAGAVDFLLKPFDGETLRSAVEAALRQAKEKAAFDQAVDDWKMRVATLTSREVEVMEHVSTGLLNKEIAAILGTAEKTIKVQRANGMRKLGVRSVAELVRRKLEAATARVDS